MKTLRTLFALLIFNSTFFIFNSFAQAPQGINYQAVARTIFGTVIPVQNVGIQITITSGNGGPILYQETHTPQTNQFGLFTITIGNGTPVSGTFSGINWGAVTPWLQVDMDPAGGTNYTNMGSSQLLSVPYALNSGDNHWGYNAGNIYNTNTGYNVGINTTTPYGLLSIEAVDEVSLYVHKTGINESVDFIKDNPGSSSPDVLMTYNSSNGNTLESHATGNGVAGYFDGGTGANAFVATSNGTPTTASFSNAGTGTAIYVPSGSVAIGIVNPVAYTRTQSQATNKSVGLMGNSTNLSVPAAFTLTYSGFGYTEEAGLYGKATGNNSAGVISYGVAGECTNSGTLGIGVMGAASGTGSNIGVYGRTSNTGVGIAVEGDANGTGGTNYGIYGYAGGATTNYAGYFSGNVYATGTITSSDAKLKKEITPLSNGLDLVMALKPSTYYYKTDDAQLKGMNLPKEKQFGLIAQQVETVIPTIVSENVQPERNISATEKTPEIHFKGLNYLQLVPVLIGAMQQQQQLIESLNAKNELLIKRIEKLENK